MNQVIINGKKYSGGKSISISNDKVIIDGVDVTFDKNEKKINIKIEGNVDDLHVNTCNQINIKGDVNSAHSTSGDIEIIGNVTENVKTTSGDIECKDVGGSIDTTSGDVRFGKVSGSVRSTGGNIKHR